MKRQAIPIVLIALLLAGIAVTENSAQSSRPKELSSSKVSSIYALAGEFRTVFANVLWAKAEVYHHEFERTNRNWVKNEDLLGLIKLIVELDPRFEEAYSVGSAIYSNGHNDPKAAVEFLQEGLKHSPKSYDLNLTVSVLYARKLKNPEAALPYAIAAEKNARDDFERHIMKREIKTLKRMIREAATARG